MLAPMIVYGAQETEFKTNGLRLLSPIAAEHTLEFGQAGSIYLEHPMDADGDWKSLLLGNIIMAPVLYRGKLHSQPFRIYSRKKRRVGRDTLISVDAQHCFYDLNYVVLDDVRPTGLNGQDALQWLFDRVYDPNGTSVLPTKNFRFYSDIETLATAYYEWKTLTGALIGEDNCVLNRWGGELYVDGLYFSICKQMEGSLTDAFHIAYGSNLVEVEETVNNANTFSQLVASDNYGHTLHGSIPISLIGLPFEKTLHAKFTYNDDMSDRDRSTQFGFDFSLYMSRLQSLDVGYKIRFAELPAGDPFRVLESYEVGDSGQVTDDELEISTTQRIMKKKMNLLTGETVSVETGTLARSIARREAFSNTVSTA